MSVDINKQYKTRDGRAVRIYAVDGGNPLLVHGAVQFPNGWFIESWNRDGSICMGRNMDADLVEQKPRFKHALFINVYENPEYDCACVTRESADFHASTRIACIPITVEGEVGEGLGST